MSSNRRDFMNFFTTNNTPSARFVEDYIAVIDMSRQLLNNENMESYIPGSAEAVNRPLNEPISSSSIDCPRSGRNLDLDNLAPLAPPFPRMMKNLLKDRRRFQKQLVSSTTPEVPYYNVNVVNTAHKALENYQLKDVFAAEMKKAKLPKDCKRFKRDVLYSMVLS